MVIDLYKTLLLLYKIDMVIDYAILELTLLLS